MDRALPEGGLAPGETARVAAPPGAGTLALVSSWARRAVLRGEPVLVLDATRGSAPHAWIEPPGATAPIWVVRPIARNDVWPATDIALRSGAFGLLVMLEPGRAPSGAGPRLIRLAREREARIVVTGEAPFRPDATVSLRLARVRWDDAPIGITPSERALEVRCGAGAAPASSGWLVEVRGEDTTTDRLRLHARAADRRPSHKRQGVAAARAGRSGRR